MRKLLTLALVLLFSATALAIDAVKDPRYSQTNTPYQWEWRFNRGFADICFGQETCPACWGVGTATVHYLDAMRFQCETGGTVSKIRVLSTADACAPGPAGSDEGGTLRMGIYADDGNYPGALLWEGTDQPFVAGAWMEEVVTGITVVIGTYYWPAFITSNRQNMCYVSGGPAGSHKYKSRGSDYAGAFEDPYPVPGVGSNSNQYSIQLCVPGGVAETYSGKFPRGIGRSIGR